MIPILTISAVIVIAWAIAHYRSRLGTGFQVAYLLRFQLIFLLTPIIIIVLSYLVAGVFGNLVDLEGNWATFWTTFVAFVASWLCLALTIIVLDHALERFHLSDLSTPRWFFAPHWFWAWSAILFAAPPLLLILRVYSASAGSRLWGIVIGFAAAFIFAVAIDITVHFLQPPEDVTRRFIFMITSYPPFLVRFFRRTDPLRKLEDRFGWLRYLGPGYLAPKRRPYPDFVAATAAIIVGFLASMTVFLVVWYRLSYGHGSTGIPTLAFLEFILMMLMFVLAAAAFYLDRYRVPVIAVLVVYSIICSRFWDTDHYWTASPAKAIATPQSLKAQVYSDAVSAWLARYPGPNSDHVLRVNNKPVVVVVCASGGGIEAAAWTAKVLTALEKDLGPLGPAFIRSIRLISSTSSGSVGALFFVQSIYSAKDVPTPNQLDLVWNASISRGLDATGWGLTYPDLARLFAPWTMPLWSALDPGTDGRQIDRGWAFEQAWRVALKEPRSLNPQQYISSMLSQWRDRVNQGLLPGTVFNATVVESGNPFLISTIQLRLPAAKESLNDADEKQSLQMPNRVIVFGQEPDDYGADISMVTAARLSATFPYVSPVAKGRFEPLDSAGHLPAGGNHIADGGYYDNFGTTVALEWIKYITQKYRDKLGRIILLQVVAFPEQQDQAPSLNPNGGWSSEFFGPVKTILNARTATQFGRDQIELDLLRDEIVKTVSTGAQLLAVPASKASCPGFLTVINFDAQHSGPLSWQLSQKEIDEIKGDWDQQRSQVDIVKRCVDGATP
jgi:hypothetical protein